MVPVGDRAGDGAAGPAGDEPGEGAAELGGGHPSRLAVDIGHPVGQVPLGAVAVDPGDEPGDVLDGGLDAEHLVVVGPAVAAAVVVVPGDQGREQPVLPVRLQLFEYPDGVGDRGAHDPGGLDTGGGVFALERAAGHLVPGESSFWVGFDGEAAAPQVFDYWWRALIPSVRYSPRGKPPRHRWSGGDLL